jgi:nicotinamide mononucleotide adenylyltransferase
MKIDVAVQSYKKPESLIYSLLSLHRHSRDFIDEVWINDDCSGEDVLSIYRDLEKSGALYPWRIRIRENSVRMGWWVSFVRGFNPKYLNIWFKTKRMIWNFCKNKSFYVLQEDIRYQWAIANTNKEFLFIIHDDIEFKDNIVSLYLESIKKNERIAIVGDLGQCWRCDYQASGCTPSKILSGHLPSPIWPSTKLNPSSHAWACRINEWSALIRVKAAREITENEHIFFGNYDDNGDVSAYWFSRVLAAGYGFDDPLPNAADRLLFYKHWDGGITGHSAWVDQGKGKNAYNPMLLRDRLKSEFGYKVRDING